MQMPLGIAFKGMVNCHYDHSCQHLIHTGDTVETTTCILLRTQVKYVTIKDVVSGLDYENTKLTILILIMTAVLSLKYKMGQ